MTLRPVAIRAPAALLVLDVQVRSAANQLHLSRGRVCHSVSPLSAHKDTYDYSCF